MSKKQFFRIIGLMSGTSLDGVDAAILETDGHTIRSFGESVSLPYSNIERAVLENVTQEALNWGFKGPKPDIFQRCEDVLHQTHVAAVQALLFKAGLNLNDIDLIGFHGQTVLHRAPSGKSKGQTLQLGNGRKLAQNLGIKVVYDFRSADVAAGGQGAPLAPIYHKALIEMGELCAETAILNIGGVTNFTLMGRDGELIASDSGPGNGPLDQWVKTHGLGEYDAGGALSFKGVPDFARIESWLKRDFFRLPIPKSADRYDFDVLPFMKGLKPEDGAATLCGFTAMSVAETLKQADVSVRHIIVCGGGRRNGAMMAALIESAGIRVTHAEDHGWDGDALEAQAFAYLAARTVKRLPLSYPKTTGVENAILGGVIAVP